MDYVSTISKTDLLTLTGQQCTQISDEDGLVL